MTASGNIEQEVLLIAGRSGSGKTSVSFEVSDQLQKADVAHCLVDGDNLDTAYPKPAADPHGIRLTEANLTALWRNYTAVGQHRLIYVNTVSVLEYEMIIRSMGGWGNASHRGDTDCDRCDRPGQADEPGGRWSAGASSATQLGDGRPPGDHSVPDIANLYRWKDGRRRGKGRR